MNDQVIFSILDKGLDCDKYVSFHKSEYIAKDKLKEYYRQLILTDNTLILKEDRIVKPKTERVEEIVVIIEPIVIR